MKRFMTKTAGVSLLIGAILGVLIVAIIRFATYDPQLTHYHANFEVFINGQRQLFKGPQYYQDVAACSAFQEMTPEKRVHMHDNVNDVVHVHDEAVTWGAFFQNLGWAIDPDFIKTDQKLYVADDTHTMIFMLNGQEQPDVTNTVIKDDDRLLINFGDQNEPAIKKEFNGIAKTAHEHDETKDPQSCSGPEQVTFKDRLKHIFATN